MKLTPDFAFNSSIYVVPPSDLATPKAPEARPLDTTERGPTTKVDQPKTWKILIATEGLRTELAANAERFGAYVAQAVEANASYFLPTTTTSLSDQAIFGARSREFLKEAIQLARALYPLDEAGRSPERSLAYAAIDQQVHRLHQAVYGSNVYDHTTGEVAWTTMCHWPLSPLLIAKFEDMPPKNFVSPEPLHGDWWGRCNSHMDADGDGRRYPSLEFTGRRHADPRDLGDRPDFLWEPFKGPEFAWNPDKRLLVLDLCKGLDNLALIPSGYLTSERRGSSYFKQEVPGSEDKK